MKMSASWVGSKVLRSPFIVKLLMIMFLMEFVKGALIVSILPSYMGIALNLSTFMVGWALALQYVGDNAFRSPVGWLIDRFGYRTIMLLGVVVTLLAVFIITITTSVSWIIFASFLLGAGTAPLWPCVITGATDVAGDEANGTIMSVVYLAWLIGIGVGPITINYFIADGYHIAFTILLVVMGLVTLISFTLPKGHHRTVERQPRAQRVAIRTRIIRYFQRVHSSMHASWLLYPAMFIQNLALGLLIPVLTLYAQKVLHLTPPQFNLYLILGGGVTALGLIPVGRWVDRYGTTTLLNIGIITAGLSISLLGFFHQLAIVIVIVIFLGLGFAFMIPSWNALLANAIPNEDRGAVWGFFLTIEGAGMVIGSVISGKLFDTWVYMPFLMSGIVLAILFVLHLFIIKKKPIVVG